MHPGIVLTAIVSWQAAAAPPSSGYREPIYPPAARRLQIAGDATFRLRVSPEGRVEEVFILSVPAPGLGFEDAVREAAREWRFEPMPAPRYILSTHSFRLRPEDEVRIRELVSSLGGADFHDSAAILFDDRVLRKGEVPWPRNVEFSGLRGRPRSIDFSAGDAGVVTLETGGVVRVLKVRDVWRAVAWEQSPAPIEPPEKIGDVIPVFPIDARQARPEHLVVLQALIDHEGRVRYLDVVTSVPELDAPALAAAREWRFRPARRKGIAIPFVMTLTVGFAAEPP